MQLWVEKEEGRGGDVCEGEGGGGGGKGARLLPVFLKLMCDINAPLESRDMTSSVKMLTGPIKGLGFGLGFRV